MRRFGGANIDEARKLVTCSAILDSNRWLGEWHGQTFECRALPDTTYLTVGSAAFCHVLPGTSELVAVWPPRQGQMMFISPGYCDNGAYWSSQLWKFDGTTFTQVWTAPMGCEITALGYSSATGLLYIAVYGKWADEPDYALNFIYTANPSTIDTVAPTRIQTYTSGDPAGYGDDYGDPCTQMCEWNGYMYFAHTAYWEYYSWVARLNLSTGDFDANVVWNEDYNGGSGGLGISGGKIWWSSGDMLYNSADGVSWTEQADFHDPAYNWWGTAGYVTDPVNDDIYFGWGHYSWGSTGVGISKIHEGALPEVIWELADADSEAHIPNQLTISYNGNSPEYVWASTWWYYGELLRAAVGSGAFSEIDPGLIPGAVLLENQCMLTYKGKGYQLGYGLSSIVEDDSTVNLYEFDLTTGARSIARSFADSQYYDIWKGGACMAVTGSSRKVHEM